MRSDRRFRARVDVLEGRAVPGSVHYHPVAVVGGGISVQTSNLPKSGGGFQVVDILNGHATDLGAFSGGITYSVGAKGGPVSGMGVIHSSRQYEVTFLVSGSVSNTPVKTESLVFNVTGGTKRFAFATGQGYITSVRDLPKGHMTFRIAGRLEQLT